MSERPATRRDLRIIAWNTLRAYPGDPKMADWALRYLAVLDAEEGDDPRAAEVVGDLLRRVVVETNPDGRVTGFHPAGIER